MQQLSMDDLAVKSTAIIRGHVIDSYTAFSGPTVYTHYHVAVEEVLKGSAGVTMDVAVPGGTSGNIRQSYPGVPQLSTGTDYVLYLWTAPSTGITFPTGFSQGIFIVTGSSASGLVTTRSASSELMIGGTGQPVQDRQVSMSLANLKSQVSAALARQSSAK